MARPLRTHTVGRARTPRRLETRPRRERCLVDAEGLRAVRERVVLNEYSRSALQRGNRFQRAQGSVEPAVSLLETASLWLLMLLSATLPLFLGGVSELGDLWLNTLGWSAVVIWIGGWLHRGRFPAVSRWVGLPVALALGLGLLASFNAECTFEGPFGGFTAKRFIPWLPSTVDASTSLAALKHWALLGALFWMSCDFCSRRTQLQLYRNALAVAGFLQIAFALGQRLADARSVLGSGWGEHLPFFGTFLYPGSAGAYLNLLIPIFCIYAFDKTQRSLVGIAGLAGLAVAIFWNTSRLSSLVAICSGSLLALLLGWIAWGHADKALLRASLARRLERLRPALVSVLLVGGLALLVFPVPPLFEKWKLLPEQWGRAYPRFEAMRACLEVTRDAGSFGFGPGTFAAVFPQYAQKMAESARGVWRHAHCDYLEWLIEWGWVGCLLWSFLPLGALIRVGMQMVWGDSMDRRTEAACAFAALVTLSLHALADFPVFNPAVQMLAVFWLGTAWSAGDSRHGCGTQSRRQQAVNPCVPAPGRR